MTSRTYPSKQNRWRVSFAMPFNNHSTIIQNITTMKTERNIITIDEYGRIHFPSTTNNDIWMNTNELIELFGIKYQILRGNIKGIYKSGVLNEHNVQKSINLSNGISIDVYALLMIVALSFRLNTLGAYKVRECVMNKLATKPRNGVLYLNVHTHECMNENKYGHN